MFYSHEILTDRKHGVATVWLIATLGAKSSLKKVGKKDILDVNVVKACQTVLNPEAPLALRLQGNLLYGLARVYEQKCGYLLTDLESARSSMRGFIAIANTMTADLTHKHTARREQIMLNDDPNFALDDLWLSDGIDSGLGLSPVQTSRKQYSQDSLINSVREDSHDAWIDEGVQDLGLDIPASNSSYSVQQFANFGGSDLSRQVEEEPRLLEDVGFSFDATGNFIDHDLQRAQGPPQSESAQRIEPSPIQHPQLGIEDAVMLDEEEILPMHHDYDELYRDAEAFPERVRTVSPEVESEHSSAPSSQTTIIAPIQRVRQPRTIPMDIVMELPNTVLADWNTNYIANMRRANEARDRNRAITTARANASYLFTNNMLRMGLIFGPNPPPPALQPFMGPNLLSTIIGPAPVNKRKRSPAPPEERSVRQRTTTPEHARAQPDDLPLFDPDQTIEVGREAATPLPDPASVSQSQNMPWNMSASARNSSLRLRTGSRGRTYTSSAVGGLSFARRASSIVSPSPLLGLGDGDRGMYDFQLPWEAVSSPAKEADVAVVASRIKDGDALNFFAFVVEKIQGHGAEAKEVSFANLLSTAKTSRAVAAQGFLHALTLTTKGLMKVEQVDLFGDITLSMV